MFSMDKIKIYPSEVDVLTSVNDIVDSGEQDNAFYICDISDLVKKYDNWRKLLPRIRTFYAVKCNDHPYVLETLKALNIGFDCASEYELSRMLEMGVAPDDIIYANPTKLEKHLKYAYKVGVNKMTFDNSAELEKIQRLHPKAEAVIRIKYDDMCAKYRFGDKFGCDHEIEAPELLELARELGVQVIGVAFHIGSSSETPSVFYDAIKAVKHVFNIAKKLGFNFRLIDIGGGYPGARNTSLKECAYYINKALDEFFPDPSLEIISEPGRYYVDSAFTLACKIYSRASTTINDKESYMYYVNAGIYNSLLSIIFGDKYYPKPLKSDNSGKKYPSIIWGPTCDSFDKMCDIPSLPKLNIGDWIITENTGAYTIPLTTHFNGFPLPDVYPVTDMATWRRLRKSVEKGKKTTNGSTEIEIMD